jgi:lipopolysaccharide export LptBFGC system permease protein LptF
MKRTVSLSIILMAVTLLMMLLSVTLVFAQQSPATQTTEGYNEVINKRAAKIVAAFHTTDTVFNKKVTAIIADQYIQLGRIHDGRNAQIKSIKAKTELTADDKAAIQKLETDADQQLAKLHTDYLAKLSALCTPQQVDEIKNGMTFNVLNVTYTAYQDMLPSLTEDQKKQILAWLTEAREKAMDAESAEKKHAWFGKYKGRINNYLSAAGIDMKKEEAAWQQRIRERKEAAKQSK